MQQDDVISPSRFPIRFFTIAAIGTAVMLAALGWYTYRSYQTNSATIERDFRLKELAGIITHLEEVLTMSARMASVTGEPQWEERYQRVESKLGVAFKEVRQLAPEIKGGKAALLPDEANAKLVEMEHRAFELIRQSRLAEAQALLFSSEYDAQKWIYSNGVEELTARLHERVRDSESVRRGRAFLSIGVVTVVLFLSICAWTFLLLIIRKWQAALMEANTRLFQKAHEWKELNLTLDQRVADRTAELSRANDQLAKEIEERKRLEEQQQKQAEALGRSNVELAEQQKTMQALLGDLQASKKKLEAHNLELARREKVMQSLLEDLNVAKERIEEQASLSQASNTKLKELAALKDEFVAKVSHELRTPLTSIKEGLSLLLDGALGATMPEQQDFLKTMDEDIDRLTDLINNMLDLSKIEAGRMRLSRARVEMPKLIESLMKSYQSILGHRTLRTEAAEEVLEIFGDPNRITQVFTNLLSNAIKFTPDDGTITFHVDRRDGMVAIAVEDSGPGMAPEDLPKLFQKFTQVGTHGSGAPRGTGLGLVVCKELTELHGGTIEVSSQVGRGTTFTVRLPAYTDALVLTESFREQLEMRSPEGGQTVSMIILHAGAFLNISQPPDVQRSKLERLAKDVRHSLHRGDTVFAMRPSWVVIIAVTDLTGVKAIVHRLREKLADSHCLRFGVAISPRDGTDAQALFGSATSRLSRDAAALQGLDRVSQAPSGQERIG